MEGTTSKGLARARRLSRLGFAMRLEVVATLGIEALLSYTILNS